LLAYDAVAQQADQPLDPLEEFLDSRGNSYQLQAYTQSEVRFSQSLSVQGGLNLSYFGINREWVLEPRLGFQWQPLNQVSIGMGYGRHSRREDLKTYFFDYEEAGTIRRNERLKRAKAEHFIASVNWKISNTLSLNVEAYTQRLFEVPVIPDSSFSFANYTQLWELDEPLTNEGTGRNKVIRHSLRSGLIRNMWVEMESREIPYSIEIIWLPLLLAKNSPSTEKRRIESIS